MSHGDNGNALPGNSEQPARKHKRDCLSFNSQTETQRAFLFLFLSRLSGLKPVLFNRPIISDTANHINTS